MKDLNPDLMVIIEQEANHNCSDFLNRFTLSFPYYYSFFKSLIPDTDAKLLWEMHLRQQINNVVASEGIDRVERHETLARWQERLSGAGFQSFPDCFPGSYRILGCEVHMQDEFTMLCWGSRPLIFFSSWIPAIATDQFSDARKGEIYANSSFMLSGSKVNIPIIIQDTAASPLIETDIISSSESDDDNDREYELSGKGNTDDHPSFMLRGRDLNFRVTIQETCASPLIETNSVTSSESDDDGGGEYDLNTVFNLKLWSIEEVRKHLVTSLTERESKTINRWMCRQLTGNCAGRDKRLNVLDTSLASLLRTPPQVIAIDEEKQYFVDDTVIDAYFELLRKRSEKFPNLYIKNHSLPTLIMSYFLSGTWTETKVPSSLKTEQIVGTSKLFIPVCLRNHWILICLNMETQALLWLDSMNSPHDAHHIEKEKISEWVRNHLLPLLGYQQTHEWQFQEPLDIPHQTNRVDCGIFVMKYADCLAHGNHFPFTQEDIPHFRCRVFLDIYCGKLSNSKWLFQENRITEWTVNENRLFENALAFYDEYTPDRWLKIAAMIPEKTVSDVIKHHMELEVAISDGLKQHNSYSGKRKRLAWNEKEHSGFKGTAASLDGNSFRPFQYDPRIVGITTALERVNTPGCPCTLQNARFMPF